MYGKDMIETSNTNTLVILIIAAGLLYITKRYRSTDQDNEPFEMAPYILAFVLIFSIKKEIQETISKERIYSFLAISSASYLITLDASLVKIVGAVFASLIMLPAIQEFSPSING